MSNGTLLFIAAVFALAGFVKGVIGLGLPTVSMGLLALVMPPAEAAAILILPSLVTNLWQMAVGPALGSIAWRLWPMMAALGLGTWAGAGLMTGGHARSAAALLGASLVLYALTGLWARRLDLPQRFEPWLAPMVGAVTGAITAATGVFVVPAVPYLQALGLAKEELVQALGLSFTVSTLALAVNVRAAGGLGASMAWMTLIALSLACLGMWAGQAVRLRISQRAFRLGFFAGLLLLGLYQVAEPML